MNKKLQQRGSALLVTVLILTSLTVVALNAANIVIVGTKLSGVQERSTIAFYAAESGAEQALWDIRFNGFTLPASQNNIYGTTTLSNGSYYVVNYATTSPAVTVTSVGSYNETERKIETGF